MPPVRPAAARLRGAHVSPRLRPQRRRDRLGRAAPRADARAAAARRRVRRRPAEPRCRGGRAARGACGRLCHRARVVGAAGVAAGGSTPRPGGRGELGLPAWPCMDRTARGLGLRADGAAGGGARALGDRRDDRGRRRLRPRCSEQQRRLPPLCRRVAGGSSAELVRELCGGGPLPGASRAGGRRPLCWAGASRLALRRRWRRSPGLLCPCGGLHRRVGGRLHCVPSRLGAGRARGGRGDGPATGQALGLPALPQADRRCCRPGSRCCGSGSPGLSRAALPVVQSRRVHHGGSRPEQLHADPDRALARLPLRGVRKQGGRSLVRDPRGTDCANVVRDGPVGVTIYRVSRLRLPWFHLFAGAEACGSVPGSGRGKAV
mmetsp:Transcript_86833/g.274101  ORF Transcript_86833/g.274101 Transcript_86833/m.274101 type:complete len:376 (+) Transcript_86833:394-1521(+)